MATFVPSKKREMDTMDLLEQLQNLPSPSVETPALPFLPPPYPMQVEADVQQPSISTPPQSPSLPLSAQIAPPQYHDVVPEKISYPNLEFSEGSESASRALTAGVSTADDKIKSILSLFPNSNPASQPALTEVPPYYKHPSTVNTPFGAVDSIQAAGSVPAPTQSQPQPLSSSPQVPHAQAQFQPQTAIQLQHVQLQTAALQQHIQAQHVSQQQAIQVQLQQQQQIQQVQQQQAQIQQIAQQQNQQVSGMVNQMQGYFDKITRYMETVDRRLTNLENVTRDILKNQTQTSSVLNINTPTVSDFRLDPVELASVKKMQEQFDTDAEVAKKIQAEFDQEYVQDLNKGSSKKQPPPKDQKTPPPLPAPVPAPVVKKPKDVPKDLSKPGEPKEACPICSTMVGISVLEDHVNSCLDGSLKGTSDPTKMSDEKKGFWSSLFGAKKDDNKVDSGTMTPSPTQTVPVKTGTMTSSTRLPSPVPTTTSPTPVSGTPMPALQPSSFVPPQYQTQYNPPLYHDPTQQQQGYPGHPGTYAYPYMGQQPIYYYVPQQPPK